MPRTSSSDSSDDGQYFVPTEGTYIVVQLDPVNMVEPLRDPDLTAAAQALQTCKYIAYVYRIIDLPIPKRPDHKCRIALAGRGPCQQDDDANIDASMCVPISPTTEHPLSRKPVPTRPSFPFPNCYQYSMAIPVVRIPTKFFYDHTNAVAISPYDLFSVKTYINEDHRKRDTLQAAKSQPAAEPLSGEDFVDHRSTRTASSSVAGEHQGEHGPVSLSDATPVGNEPVADAFESDPPTLTTNADAYRSDVAADTPKPEPAAPHHANGISKDGPAEEGQRILSQSDQSQVGRTAVAPDVSDVDTTAAHRSVKSFEQRSSSQRSESHNGDDDGRSTGSSSTHSMIESIADRPRSASPAPSDLLHRIFLGNPDEDRDIIPLVSVSLDLSDAGEVNDPMAFLKEIEVIQQLVLEYRSKHDQSDWDCESSNATSVDTSSWVDVTADAPSILEQRDTTARKRTRISKLCDATRFKLRTRARYMRRRGVAFLKVVKAVLTCSFTVRIEYTLDLN
ncbi:uncharacterized protein C8Q71DRAFT_193222 [Rhodofomes roseus]|uniref:Uncharacterized protein n=1 Tax=Rhodofomes roseus TaxID=34475 RepID=A0ABQ8K7E4_9APHY|nr:uncharacterized protein C8Q71DRAFT_193222 [Rhodofomes roseus]KAH9833186.1 hypothetical protein C8Q71DRAFT_193222 [Rhodofomes roseus]